MRMHVYLEFFIFFINQYSKLGPKITRIGGTFAKEIKNFFHNVNLQFR